MTGQPDVTYQAYLEAQAAANAARGSTQPTRSGTPEAGTPEAALDAVAAAAWDAVVLAASQPETELEIEAG